MMYLGNLNKKVALLPATSMNSSSIEILYYVLTGQLKKLFFCAKR